VFGELGKDLVRGSYTVITDGQEKPLIPAGDRLRFGEAGFKSQAQQSALQTIFAKVAGSNANQFLGISRWCQQGAFAYISAATATRNSPFKLNDGTPMFVRANSGEITHQLARQGSDVLLTSTIVFRPPEIAKYYESEKLEAFRPTAAGSQCGVTHTLRIDGSGQVSLEKPPTSWSILALAAD